MSTTHVLERLQSTVSPAAMAAGTDPGLKAGKDVHAMAGELVSMYGNVTENSTALERIGAWAKVATVAEFAEACKKALETASTTDASNGFKPAEDAKGQEKYGPVRKQIASRMSEARNLFGVLKMEPKALANKGYFAAVQAARAYLNDKQIKWDGRPADKEAKEASRTFKLRDQARIMARAANERQQGETIEAYETRINGLLGDYVKELEAQTQSAHVKRVAESIVKQFGDDEAALKQALRMVLEALEAAEQEGKAQPAQAAG
jgi:hypothetical protein